MYVDSHILSYLVSCQTTPEEALNYYLQRIKTQD